MFLLRIPRRPAAIAVAGIIVSLALSGVLRAGVDPGEYLLSEMNCAACHDPGPVKARLASRPSPRLDAAHGVGVTPQWLRAFLQNPQAEKPGTLMPDMLSGLDDPARAEAAEALTHFLVSLRGAKNADPVGQSPAAIKLGRSLYH